MTADVTAIAVLAAMALLWLFVNIKAASRSLKWLSFIAMWVFLIAATVAAVRFALGVLA